MTPISFLSSEGPAALYPVLLSEQLVVELLARQKEVLDLREAASFLKTTDEDVLRMVKEQGLPGRQVGDGWRFLKAAVCDWLRAGTPPRRSGKEALLAFAGSWKDDPHLEDMVEDIYKNRGRSVTDGGSYRLFQGLEAEGAGK